jgi:hypothetical protein
MARKIISKKTITFYEGDEKLLENILKTAEAEKRNFSSFAIKALMDAIGDVKDHQEEKTEIPDDSVQALNGW